MKSDQPHSPEIVMPLRRMVDMSNPRVKAIVSEIESDPMVHSVEITDNGIERKLTVIYRDGMTLEERIL